MSCSENNGIGDHYAKPEAAEWLDGINTIGSTIPQPGVQQVSKVTDGFLDLWDIYLAGVSPTAAQGGTLAGGVVGGIIGAGLGTAAGLSIYWGIVGFGAAAVTVSSLPVIAAGVGIVAATTLIGNFLGTEVGEAYGEAVGGAFDTATSDVRDDMHRSTNGSDPAGACSDPDTPGTPRNDGSGTGFGDYLDHPPISPIVLDLDGDGIELRSLHDSRAMFDMNGDGLREWTGWLAGDDGFLARDINNNGIIDDITELFGGPNTDAFSLLATLDTNGDNRLNSSDSAYGELLLWRDANENGISSAAEVMSVIEAGVAEINLQAVATAGRLQGHLVSAVSTAEINGSSAQVADVWFEYNSSITDRVRDESFLHDRAVFSLPQLRGFGNAPDLWVAMTNNPNLLAMVTSLVNEDLSNFSFSAFKGNVEEILFEWLGVSSVSASSRGEWIDGRVMEAIEAWQAQDYELAGSDEPNEYAGAGLTDAWNAFVEGVATRMLVQIPWLPLAQAFQTAIDLTHTAYTQGDNLEAYTTEDWDDLIGATLSAAAAEHENHPLRFLDAVSYDFTSNSFVGTLEGLINALVENEPTATGAKQAYWIDMLGIVNTFANALEVSAGEYEAALTGSYLDSVTSSGPLLQYRYDHIDIGTAVRDVIDYSGEPEGNYNKFLVGAGGDDRIHGAYGANVFYYNLGDGDDSYRVWNQDYQSDGVVFGPDIERSDISSIVQSTDSVRINLSDGGEIFLENQLESKLGGVEYFEFWDGTIYTSSELMALVRGVDYSTNPSDVIYAVNAGGLPYSTGGKAYQEDAPYLTTIYVSVRNQTGTAIANTTDDDIYRSQRYDAENFGYDLHLENGTYEITLKFAELVWNAAGARKFDVKMEGILVEDDLDVFSLAGGKNAALDRVHYVTITDENLDLDLLLGSVDNPMISGFVIRSVASAPIIAGTSSGNSLAGTPGSELIQGLEGNDTLIGGLGHDTLDGGAGRDTLTGGAGEDIFRFSALTHSQGAVGSDPAIYDRITDFENHIDKFDLTGLGFVRFITSGTTQAGELRAAYSSTSDRTYVKSDQLPFSFYLDGNRLADLDGSDFLLDPSAGNLIYGTLSADNLTGTSLDDKVLGLLGDDSINGGLGSDTINGSVGEDRLTGGSGADVFKFTGLTHSVGLGGLYDRIVDFQDGIDRIDVSDLGFTGLVSGVTSVGQLRFTVNSGGTRTYVHSDQSDFEFFLDGNWGSTLSAADFIFYTAPSGGINGTATADTLSGTSANETLRGLGGDDTLSGGSGNDTLNGGADKDRLTGGAGADIFQFTDRTHSLHTGGFYDRIVDFEDGIDKIDLSGLGFTTLTTSTPQIDQLRLSYSSASNRTYVKNDPSDFSFFLDGDWVSNGLLTNADFIFA